MHGSPYALHKSRSVGTGPKSDAAVIASDVRVADPVHSGRSREPSATLLPRSEAAGEGPRPRRQGKAPPVDPFTRVSPGILFDDWYPSLQRAAEWNSWSEAETLIQFAGYLRGRALQEWGLLPASDKSTLERAVDTLRNRLDPVSRTLAAQDFRHTSQKHGESVADFIRRLEQMFKLAYGRDEMSDETRKMLLHRQLQEGLPYELMKAPAVSGSHSYPELCLAARNEEKRLAELAKRRLYSQPTNTSPGGGPRPRVVTRPDAVDDTSASGRSDLAGGGRGAGSVLGPRRCYSCGRPGHLSRNCPTQPRGGRGGGARQVQTSQSGDQSHSGSSKLSLALTSYLYSGSEDEDDGVRQV